MWKPLMLIWFLPQGYIEANLQILEFGAVFPLNSIFLFKYFDAYVPGTVPGAMLDKKYSSE